MQPPLKYGSFEVKSILFERRSASVIFRDSKNVFEDGKPD